MTDTWNRIEDVPVGVMVTDKDGDPWVSGESKTPRGMAFVNKFAPFKRVES